MGPIKVTSDIAYLPKFTVFAVRQSAIGRGQEQNIQILFDVCVADRKMKPLTVQNQKTTDLITIN